MKKRYELSFRSFYDVDGMARHLELRASQGWFLEKFKGNLWCFVRKEPKNVHYVVSYYNKASMFQPEPSEGEQTFQAFCAHTGWELAASDGKLQVFRNEQPDPVPIYTDPETQVETIEGSAKTFLLPYWMLVALLGIQLVTHISRYWRNPLFLLTSSSDQGNFVSFSLLVLFMGLELGHYYSWRHRARAAAEQGEFVPTSQGPLLRPWLLAFAMVSLFYGIFASRNSLMIWVFSLWILGFLLLIFLVQSVRSILKARKVSTERNRFITLAVDVVLAFALTGAMTWGTLHSLRQDQPKPEPEALSLTPETITGVADPEAFLEQQDSFSPLVSTQRVWTYPSQGKSLSYTVYTVHWTGLRDWVRDLLLKARRNLGDHNEDYDPAHPFYVYEETDPGPWGADRAWQERAYGELNSVYLVEYDGLFLWLCPSWELSPEEIARVGAAMENW